MRYVTYLLMVYNGLAPLWFTSEDIGMLKIINAVAWLALIASYWFIGFIGVSLKNVDKLLEEVIESEKYTK